MRPGDELPGRDRANAGERLTGLGLILFGVLGLGLAYLLWLYAPAAAPAPAGLPRGFMPITSPLTCMLPVIAIGGSLLVLIGLHRLIFPD